MGDHKPRKRRLSPMQREILWMLESAGAHDLPVVINTLWDLFADTGHEMFLWNVEEAIRDLSRLGYVTFCHDAPQYPLVDPKGTGRLLAISDQFDWNDDRGYWQQGDRRVDTSGVMLQLTDTGRQALTR